MGNEGRITSQIRFASSSFKGIRVGLTSRLPTCFLIAFRIECFTFPSYVAGSTPISLARLLRSVIFSARRSRAVSAEGCIAFANTSCLGNALLKSHFFWISRSPVALRRYSRARLVGAVASIIISVGILLKTQPIIITLLSAKTQRSLLSIFICCELKIISSASKIVDFPISFTPMNAVNGSILTLVSSR